MDQHAELDHRVNRVLAAFPDDAFATLERHLKTISMSHGEELFEAGAMIDRVYFPLEGLISLLVVTRNGEAIESAIVGREGAVGLQRGLGERRSFTRANVQVAGRFAVLPAKVLEDVTASSPAVQRIISAFTEVMWAEAQQLAACNAIHSASERLSRWLLQASERLQSEQVPLTQEFLAQMLGIRRTTVTILAQELQAKGAIKYSRGRITIIDRAGLRACACECYRIIQHDHLPGRIGVHL